ncbi:MAG TPA: RDD family protein [Rhodanobacteraceae bacterium]
MTTTPLWSVTLTGALAPTADAQAVWSRVATLLHADAATLVARLPVTFKAVDAEQAQHQRDELAACGAVAVSLPDDGAPRLWVRVDGRTVGPVSTAYAQRARDVARWPGDTLVCRHGQAEWLPLDAVLPPASSLAHAPDVVPVAGPMPPRDEPVTASAVPVALDRESDDERPAEPEVAMRVSVPAAVPVAAPATVAGSPDILPTHHEAPELHAGFWRRVAAYLIDYAIVLAGIFVLGFLLGLTVALATGHVWHAPRLFWDVVTLVAFWLYFALFEASPKQATPGKLALGLRVTGAGGRRIDFGQATGRFYGRILCGLTLGIGYLMAGWTARKQALHDKLADCCVVRAGALEQWSAHDADARDEPVRHGLPGWAFALVLTVSIVVAMLPVVIMLGGATHAYHGYLARAQITRGLTLATEAKAAVVAYQTAHGQAPADNLAAGLAPPASIHGKYVSSVSVNQGYIVLTYGRVAADKAIRGGHLVLALRRHGERVGWHCSSPDLKALYLPRMCR